MRKVCTVLLGLLVTSCGSSTEIPTVAEDPWAPPEAPVEDAGWEDSDEFKPPCGNGGECNPMNLGGETCPGLGMGDGTLSCDPVTCTYDTSMCEGSTGMGNGGNGSTGMGNNGMAGTGSDQPFFGGGNNNGNTESDGGVPFFGGNFFGGNAGMSGGGDGDGDNPDDGNTPQFFGGNFFGGDADGGVPFFGGGFFGGNFFGGGADADGGTAFFGGGFFGGNFFGGGNNNDEGNSGDEDPMDAGI